MSNEGADLVPLIRAFLASPRDADAERDAVERKLHDLNYAPDLRDHVSIKVNCFEKEPMQSGDHPQTQLIESGHGPCDGIVTLI